tara:strand:- start:157 stop:693 length:537 start_codon:yes stop_codon:yes gene_type:complete
MGDESNWNMPAYGNNGLSNAYGSNTDYGQSFNYGSAASPNNSSGYNAQVGAMNYGGSLYPELYQTPSTSPNPQQPNIFGKIWNGVTAGGTDSKGFQTANNISGGISAISSLASAYMGMKQYGLAKDQFKFQQKTYNDNYRNATASYNTDLEARQAARYASNPNHFEPVDSYMDKNRLT